MTEWMANSHPLWAAYRDLLEVKLIGLDTQPRIITVIISETWCQCFSKFVMGVAGLEAKQVCWGKHLCSGLKAVIEGGIHVICLL